MWTTQKLSTTSQELWIKCEQYKHAERCGGDEMKQAKVDGQNNGRVTKEELLAKLMAMEDESCLNSEEESPEQSEAEQLAATAEPPKLRVDGRPKGSERIKPLTQKQHAFAKGLIEGKTQEQAYRDAYPDAQAKASVIKSNAWKLSQDIRIKTMVEESWGETVEAMTDDAMAVRRYVIKQLLHHSKEAKQEGTKLKALEMMGKSVGMFRNDMAEKDEVVVTADQLKRELAGHIKLLNNIKPMTRTAILEAEPLSVINNANA